MDQALGDSGGVEEDRPYGGGFGKQEQLLLLPPVELPSYG